MLLGLLTACGSDKDAGVFNGVFFDGEVMPNSTQVNLSNGLVLYLPFDGNAQDASGKGNHGTVSGATLTTDRNGKARSAYSKNYTT